jgi:hypothetical protein
MAYIGKTPTVGNFQKCDAISVVNGQAAYTLQVGGSNVSPESPNHVLVSLNGILQAPTDSYTISGSTLTFASNLATGDVIDFVMLLGNVLDLGTPSDNTVTNAKLATTSITGQTAETSAADADTILIHDDSASALRKMTRSNFLSGVGETNTPAFRAYNNASFSFSASTTTKMRFNAKAFDTATAFDTSDYDFTVPSGQGGKYFLNASMRIQAATDKYAAGYFFVNGSEYMLLSNVVRDDYSGELIVNITGTADLSAGDIVDARCNSNISSPTMEGSSSYSHGRYSFFEGFKIAS